MAAKYKLIDGENYGQVAYEQYKAKAQKIAKEFRFKGVSARVIKDAHGYGVWTPYPARRR